MSTFLFCTAIMCNAQAIKVIYSEQMDLTEKIKSINNPLARQMILEELGKPSYYELISNNGTSVYRKQSIYEENSYSDVTVVRTDGQEIIYRDQANNTHVKQTDFMSRTFLIKDNLPSHDWFISSDSLIVGGYHCRKAILKNDDKHILAWYTSEVPSNEGPRDFYGLPGLIMKVETGVKTIEARSISILKNDIPKIEAPVKGKKITRKEFEKITQEKIDNLRGNQQSENGVQVFKF